MFLLMTTGPDELPKMEARLIASDPPSSRSGTARRRRDQLVPDSLISVVTAASTKLS